MADTPRVERVEGDPTGESELAERLRLKTSLIKEARLLVDNASRSYMRLEGSQINSSQLKLMVEGLSALNHHIALLEKDNTPIPPVIFAGLAMMASTRLELDEVRAILTSTAGELGENVGRLLDTKA